MNIYKNPTPEKWGEILKRPLLDIGDLYENVNNILSEIRKDKTSALKKYTEKYDGILIKNFSISEDEINNSENKLEKDLKDAIEIAANNIRTFHKAQIPEINKIETSQGVYCWQKPIPIEKIGIYIPGGSAPLFSTVLMLAIPANLAGCKDIIMCTPPNKNGEIHPAILYTAKISGVTKIFKIGGIQAIGAMAFGIDPVPKVDKIIGPGNQYVMAAKQLVSIADVSIDMPAGPSEVAIIADQTSNPAFIASDLLSQAEHGHDSQVLLVSRSEELVKETLDEIEKQLEVLDRKEIAKKALVNSNIIILENDKDIISIINQYAPEHLIITSNNYVEISSQIKNAGSVFLGNFTPESAGDYASGTNHILPTNGWARSYNGVNIDSFLKKITFQEITRNGIENLGPVIEKMAETEKLQAHKNAVSIRLEYLKNNK